MIVGVCGYGYSGSGAVLDLLKEYDEVYVADKMEFSFPYKPDGIEDLGRAICYNPRRYWSSDSAIRRFKRLLWFQNKKWVYHTKGRSSQLIETLLSRIIQTSWNGSTTMHIYQSYGWEYYIKQRFVRRVRSLLEKKLGFVIRRTFWPDKKMFYSYLSKNIFESACRDFINGFIEAISDNNSSDIIVLDQPYPANDPKSCFWLFNSPKAIIVNKDPRDIYLLAKKTLGVYGKFIPVDDVESFIIYYRGLMHSRNISNDDPDILEINVEDLIYNYCNTKLKIENFIGIKHSDLLRNPHFDPNISINNTQLWMLYPQFNKDIYKIEKELADYLFDFGKYNKKPDFNIHPF